MVSHQDIVDIVGAKNVMTAAEAALRSVRWGNDEPCRCRMLVMPTDTEQVAGVVRACAEVGQTIVIHGGRTGMAGGAVSGETDVVLSLEKLNRIESFDSHGRTMIVGAGVTVQQVQEYAQDQGALFAVDYGARGSATVGGAIATNAGGNRVFRYGMMREQVLGLEVVLADGTIVNGLKGLIKDNSGYDLKQLFIGSEGTLGIVTRAVLRLRPLMASRSTALITFQRFEQVLIFLRWIEARLGGTLSAFELMWQSFFAAVTRHSGGIAGLPPDAPFYALVEAEGGDSEQDDAGFLAAMEAALEQGLFEDAVIAKSAGEREALWAIREDIDILMRMGDRIDFDVSLPTSGMAAYLDHVQNRLATEVDDCTLVVFGHIADNNLHAMAIRSCPFAADERHLIKAIMYEQLRAAGGSVSAEHGIGLDKKAALPVTRTSAELALMRRIKRCMDPHDLLNPGKIVDLAAAD